MGYGEKFQGMTPDMVMVEVATRLGSIETKVDMIETKVDAIKCPSPKCNDHEQRIAEQERIEKERKAQAIGRNGIILIILTSVLSSGLVVWVAGRISGG